MMSELNSDTPYIEEIEKARYMYFSWLCVVVQADQFETLCGILHNIEFYSPITLDDNRIDDAVDLRKDWYDRMEEAGYSVPNDALAGPPSLFEVLVALAERCERQIMGDSEYGNRTPCWFWEMVMNVLDANDMDAENCSDDIIDGYVSGIIHGIFERVLDRKYESNGLGGFFPLRHPRFDQTQAELWVQLNQYVMENYEF